MKNNQHSTKQISRSGQICSRMFIRLMFSAVNGWKQAVPSTAKPFIDIGRDGSRLEGAVQLTNKQEPKGVVLLCHPFLKYGMHYFYKNKFDRELNAEGFHIVTFNFKGFGHSNIKGHAFCDDVLSISDYIKKQYPDLPLHVLGCSFGGFQLSHALAKDKSAFTSVVLDSVPCSVSIYFKHGLLGPAMNWISKSRFGQATGTAPIGHALSKVDDLPIAFLYGNRDKYAPKQDIDALKAQCRDIHFIEFDDCGHLESFKKHQLDYIQTVVQFFNDNALEAVNRA